MRRHRSQLTPVVVTCAALFAVIASVAIGLSGAPLNGDEGAHLDYAVDVWHHRLPVFENGLTITPPFGSLPTVQWVSQHPPLFYAILAPVVGPLWDSGALYGAVLAGRFVNAILAGLTVLACAWSARRIAPRRPDVAAVTAVIVSLTSMLLLVGGAIYNDLPNVAFGALALGVGASAIRNGLTTRLVILGAVVTAAGMLSRLSFAVFVAAVVVAFFCALGFRRGHGFWNGWLGRICAAALSIAAPVLASGWFYLRNLRLTGNIAGSHPAWAEKVLHRTHPSFGHTVKSADFWSGMFSVFRGHEPADSWGWTWLILLVPLVMGVVVVSVPRLRRNGLLMDARERAADGFVNLLVVAMLVAVVALLVLLQIAFVVQGGASQARYGLPAMPVLAIAMAFGLGSLGRLISPVLITLWVAATGVVWVQILNFTTPAYKGMQTVYATRIAAGAGLTVLVAVVVLIWILAWRRRRGAAPGEPVEEAPPGEIRLA